MPNEKTPTEGTTGFPDVEKNNEEVARKLAEQGREELTKPEDLVSAGDALDKLVAEKNKPEPVVEQTPEEKAKAEADAKAAEEKTAAEKAEADRIAAERDAHLKKSDEYFKDSPTLPANASPKSTEAFSHVKIKAAQEISAREAKIEELNKQLAEAQEKLKNPIPPELEAELKQHREWRAKIDIDFDPKFKEFDKAIETSREFIYSQLKKSPAISDAVIAEIKKHGGPDLVVMGKLFDAIKDPTIQRLVESKIADIEMAKFNKEQAISSAKKNVEQYASERQKASEKVATQHNEITGKALENYHKQALQWLAEKPLDPKADDATKKSVEEHNKFIKEVKASMAEALHDDSPEMRALMIAGMGQLLKIQRDYGFLKADNEVKDSKITALDKTVAELTEKMERFKKASTSRFHETGAPSDGKLPEVKKESDLFKPASQALDDAAKEIMEKRAAAGR